MIFLARLLLYENMYFSSSRVMYGGGVKSKYRKLKYQRSEGHSSSNHRVKFPDGQITGIRTFHPMQFQPMQFQPLPFQPLTISTNCIFNRPQFRPKLILANGS